MTTIDVLCGPEMTELLAPAAQSKHVGDLADDAGMGWVEFMNWVADNCPTPSQIREQADAMLDELFGAQTT